MTALTIGSALAEAATLGCLLRAPLAQGRALLALLREDDWTDPRHRAVFLAARTLLQGGVPADPVTVEGQLRRSGTEKAHTADKSAAVFLVELCQAAPALSSAGHYARVVLEHTYRRRLQQAAVRLQDAAGALDLDELHDLVLEEVRVVEEQRQRVAGAAPRVVQPA